MQQENAAASLTLRADASMIRIAFLHAREHSMHDKRLASRVRMHETDQSRLQLAGQALFFAA